MKMNYIQKIYIKPQIMKNHVDSYEINNKANNVIAKLKRIHPAYRGWRSYLRKINPITIWDCDDRPE